MEQKSAPAPANLWTRSNPFVARISENRLLSKPGSNKDTRHIVVDIEGSNLAYHIGDSLGVFAKNPANLVDELLRLLKIDP